MDSNVLRSFYDWISPADEGARERAADDPAFQQYFEGIAEARYVVRRVFRIVDEQARKLGLEPLEHQALIQIFGAGEPWLRVNHVAERLDIAPAFASRLIKSLEDRGLVKRTASEEDKRITLVEPTDAGREHLAQIDREVQVHVDYFQRQLRGSARVAALGIFAFYLGATPRIEDLEGLLESAKR
jgi:DNA-binding MarR family transcriptional regulator